MRRRATLFFCLLAASAAGGQRASDFAAVRESLEHVPRKRWAWWLEDHGHDATRFTTYQRPDSQGLHMIGKWGRGPSVEVTGRDTLVVLTLGSEVALLSFADPSRPRVLSEIQLDYLPRQSQLVDSLLFTGGNGIQIWNVADPTRPVRRGVIPYAVGDFSVQDTLAYFVSHDTFFVYTVADPASPRRVGFCRDSGYVATTTATTAVLLFRDFMGFMDISDPSSPQRVGTFPGWALSAQARGSLCCAAFSDINNQDRAWFLTLDISDPASPRQLGRADSVCGYDICLEGSFALVSGRYDAYEEFRVVSIADSTQPRRRGTCFVAGDNWGVWSPPAGAKALVASEPSGLVVLDIGDPDSPTYDTSLLRADQAVDVWLDGNRAYVANYRAGVRILDVSGPTAPAELGGYDSLQTAQTASNTVVAADSFAFAGWWPSPRFRSLLVSEPSHPELAGSCFVETEPYDMVLRDTLVYLAGRLRFNVVNVARPREPRLVGSCNAGDLTQAGLVVRDTLAYFSGPFVGMQVFSVANPAAPYLVNTVADIRAKGVDVVDSLLYVGDYDDSLHIWSFANPRAPEQLSSLFLTRCGYGTVVLGRYAYVGSDLRVRVVDVSDPLNPRQVDSGGTPYEISRVVAGGDKVYVCCWDAGVCIFDTAQVGVSEAGGMQKVRFAGLIVIPTPTERFARVATCGGAVLRVFDVTGRNVTGLVPQEHLDRAAKLDLAQLAPGLYFAEVASAERRDIVRLVKQ